MPTEATMNEVPLNALLMLPRLRVQNANTISSPLTWGFPAITRLHRPDDGPGATPGAASRHLSDARVRGRVGGRKPKLNEKQIREIKTLLTDPVAQVKDIAKRYEVSRTTLYKRVGIVHPQKPD